MENIGYLVCFAAHSVAAILWLLLEMVVWSIQEAGPAAWGLSLLWAVLLALDWTGRVNLHGAEAKLIAALLLPILCGLLDVVLRSGPEEGLGTPAVWSGLLLLLLLTGSVLFRRVGGAGERSPGERAEALLLCGCDLSVAQVAWVALLLGGVLFMSTFGILFSLILGGLMYTKNGLLDYVGVAGVLAGLVLIYLAQAVLFRRAIRLAKEEDPWLDTEGLRFALLIPVWNGIEARRLRRQLREQRLRRGSGSVWEQY